MAELIEKMGRTTYNELADALLSDLNSADVQAEEKVRGSHTSRPTHDFLTDMFVPN